MRQSGQGPRPRRRILARWSWLGRLANLDPFPWIMGKFYCRPPRRQAAVVAGCGVAAAGAVASASRWAINAGGVRPDAPDTSCSAASPFSKGTAAQPACVGPACGPGARVAGPPNFLWLVSSGSPLPLQLKRPPLGGREGRAGRRAGASPRREQVARSLE